MGLPRDSLRDLIAGCQQGHAERAEVVVEAVNRRGQPIRCRVVCSPLRGGGRPDDGGVLVLMEEWSGLPASEEAHRPPGRRAAGA